MLPEAIENLAEKFRLLPGIGHKGSLKMALDVLQMPKDKFDELQSSLYSVKTEISLCPNCGFFAQSKEHQENLTCQICQDKNRLKNQICLVEKPTDVITIEKSQVYRGYYHVLNNLISPLDNIFAEDTTIADLIDRRLGKIVELSDLESQKIELILFFKLGFAAQATTAYLREILKQKQLINKVKITRLAQGLPMYYNPEALDQATMAKALEDRREVE